ncbi:GNAT family N-acetyltransferase [Actibacterium lipolyticum]|uniref:Ribosomal-protein-alanine N-acetyltransferase n=1 Tax=Actibacterium lipolyticum TaxID=1524263 RepID=A0A238JLX9_9RHOB|nr:GNAT family N-acetyltransferase [Actibacterium lipolyticum]SMX31204.1 ribosomal-protein-alanine N-acetyltransferase [Actibacterium lipolyticum]
MTPETLAELHALCFTTPRPWGVDEFRSVLRTSGAFLHGDENGFVLGRVIADEAEVLTIAVHPDARQSGNGRRLLAAFDESAKNLGATETFLEVAADNTPALALYSAAGYGQAGRRLGYYKGADGQPVDALILRKSL